MKEALQKSRENWVGDSYGSGKSTLLNLISYLDSPTKGEVYIEGVGISTLNGFEKSRVNELLSLVGLDGKGDNKPTELSGGEQQRVAIARALANNPKIILADEPTGNLDTHTGKKIMELLMMLNREEEKTLVIVTHDLKIAEKANHLIKLQDGTII